MNKGLGAAFINWPSTCSTEPLPETLSCPPCSDSSIITMGVREYLRGPRLQWALALTGAVAWILQGYDSALMNGLLTLPSFEQTFPQIDTSTASKKASHAVLQGRSTFNTIRLVLYQPRLLVLSFSSKKVHTDLWRRQALWLRFSRSALLWAA